MSVDTPRADLANAIAARETAEGVAAEASQAVERATELHRLATATLAGFDGLDVRIGQHHADAIRRGGSHRVLSPELTFDRDARDAARGDVVGLEAGLRHLAGEHADAMQALAAARRAVDEAAGGVLAADAAEIAEQVDLIEADARELRDRMEALIATCRVRVPDRVLEVNGRRVMSHWEAMSRPIHRAGQSPVEQGVVAYLERLRGDATARMS